MARRFGNSIETASLYDPQGRLIAQESVKRPDPWQGNNALAFLVGDAFGERSPVELRISRRVYQYNAAGQLASIDDSRRGRTQYLYDPLDRLTRVEGPLPETLIHDPAHNLLAVAESEEAAQAQAAEAKAQGNRLAFFGDTHYVYDAHGNRIEARRGKEGKLTTRYRYDEDNQLVEVVTPTDTVRFAYDPLGRRVEKASEKGCTAYLWNGDVLLEEAFAPTGSEAVERRTYIYEPGGFRPLALIEGGKRYFYHLDHLGTPLELSDEAGEIVWAVSYRSYGSLALAHEAQIEQPLRFQGQYFDAETGLHYNRFRYYDPMCGRFIHQDPIGLLGGVNSYQYVPNPTGWVDPLGLACKEILENPKSIWGKSADEIAQEFRDEGYEVVVQQGTKGSKLSQQIRIVGHPEITNIQVHPGGGRHVGAYYKISTSTRGKIKVVDKDTYKPDPAERVEIVYRE